MSGPGKIEYRDGRQFGVVDVGRLLPFSFVPPRTLCVFVGSVNERTVSSLKQLTE